jgi:predicted HD phosphohydrolase
VEIDRMKVLTCRPSRLAPVATPCTITGNAVENLRGVEPLRLAWVVPPTTGRVEVSTEAAREGRVDVLTQKPAERMPVVTYIEMDKGTKEEYTVLRDLAQPFRSRLADRLLVHMELLHDSYPGEQVDRYVHSLQTATRAHRHGADEETVVAALLHDIGDMLGQDNHGELAAAILRPYVSSATEWVVAKHGIFQGYYYFHHFGMDRNQREEFRGHPAYEKAIRFSEWDQASFDPHYETLPIEVFEPMVRRIFAREPWGFQTKI